MDGTRPPAGWYADDERPGWLRWWDGAGWGDFWSAAPPSNQHTACPSTPHASARPSRRRLRLLASIAVVIAVSSVVAVAVFVASTQSGRDDSSPRGGEAHDGSADGRATDDDARPAQLIDRCNVPDPPSLPGLDIAVDPMTLDQEIDVGAETRERVLDAYAVSSDSSAQSMLDDLLDEMQPAGSPIPFSVTLLDESEVNAFAIPGGDLFFTTGIVDLMSDDELAFVMGHEIAHVQCRHLAQRYEREVLATAGLELLLGTEIDTDELYENPATALLADFASLPFSRVDESESDLASLDLLERAGRPLDAGPAALRALRDLETHEPSRLESLLSTHPPTRQRIDDLEAAIANR